MVWEDSFKRVVVTVQVSQTRCLTFMRIILIYCPIFQELIKIIDLIFGLFIFHFFFMLLKINKPLVFY